MKINRRRSSPIGPGSALVVEHAHRLDLAGVPGGLAADHVDRAVAGGHGDPRPGVGGQPVGGPALQSDHEGILHGLLGEIDAAELAHEGGDRPAGLVPEDRRHLVVLDHPRSVLTRIETA